MSSIQNLKAQTSAIIREHTRSDDAKAFTQLLTTLAPLAALWGFAVLIAPHSLWLTAATVPLISLFTLRVFALMHECGHGSLFRTAGLNRTFGFLLGVVSGMPQQVWSRNHSYHHAHNGNWQRYRGPYTTLSVDEYAAMTTTQQRLYRSKCSIGLAPVAGFIYLIFNPRFTWLKGSVDFVHHVIRAKALQPAGSMKSHAEGFSTRYWKSAEEYRHMLWNNLALLSIWALMCWSVGPLLFFAIYLASVSLAGGAGIVLFTVQHNFPHAYASDDEHWDYDTGAMAGTSFLILPRWLNWFTADIAYHHIHHLSSRIPNYRLAKCHDENRALFSEVTRVKLSHVHNALKCILWDTRAQRIISVAEYRLQVQ